MKTKKKYKYAVIAADVVIFTIRNDKLEVLLIAMKKKPFAGKWAVPGGLVRPRESIDNAAKRQLKEKTGISNVYLEQLATFGEPGRDPFGRVVSVAYFALMPSDKQKVQTTKEYADISWFPVSKLPELAYDHDKIIFYAFDRLQSKLEYTNIVYSLLPKEFTLSELQKVYEIILRKKIDKRNFRKKILSLGLVREIGRQKRGEANRPAGLYCFTKRRLQVMEII